MKYGVVISVGPGQTALEHAVKTQSLLLQHMGDKLDSIRLAVPRLLEPACLGAVADLPDVLVVAGGPRTARRAGQIAHEKGIPILFLPGLRSPHWAKRLWGCLPLEGLIAALAREEIRPARLGVGIVGDRVFFGDARCGLFAQLDELHEGFREREGGWKVLMRAADVGKSIVRPGLEIHSLLIDVTRAAAFIVTAQNFDGSVSRTQAVPLLRTFSCTAWKHPDLFTHMHALLRAAAGRDWRKRTDVEHFECDELNVDAHGSQWIVLDDEPNWFSGIAAFRFLPEAVRTCAFRIESAVTEVPASPPGSSEQNCGTIGSV